MQGVFCLIGEDGVEKPAMGCNMITRNNDCEIHSENKRRKNGNTEAKNQWLLEYFHERYFLLRGIISVFMYQSQLFKITDFICLRFSVLHIHYNTFKT